MSNAPATPTPKPRGNRCGHNPPEPKLNPAIPIKKGPGGKPPILAFAAELLQSWYERPSKCPQLDRRHIASPQSDSKLRQIRSERREAWQIMLGTVLSLMDLNSMCLGRPRPSGFEDVSMEKIMEVSGMGKRRCERALKDLHKAGFFEPTQRRGCSKTGKWFGLRAIRQVKECLFEMIDLGKLLKLEQKKAKVRLDEQARKWGVPVSRLVTRVGQAMGRALKRRQAHQQQKSRDDMARLWNAEAAKPQYHNLPPGEAEPRINMALGFPEGYAPGSA